MANHGPLRPKVLIVDDDRDSAELLHELLRDAGYAVASAYDGAAALDMLMTHEPAVILVDLRMPTIDGWSFIERYRGRGGHARILVITALGDVVKRQPIAGVDALAFKPFELEDLLATVADLVQPRDASLPVA